MSAIVQALLDELRRDPRALGELADAVRPYLERSMTPPQATLSSPWLNVDQAAQYIGAAGKNPRQRIYDLVHAKRLTPRKDGSRSVFHRDQLDAYLRGKKDDGAATPAAWPQARSREGRRPADAARTTV